MKKQKDIFAACAIVLASLVLSPSVTAQNHERFPTPPGRMMGDQYHALVARPGQLREAIPADIARGVRRLSIRGMLNSEDVRHLMSILKRSSCVNDRGRTIENFVELDLSDTEFAQSVSSRRDVIPHDLFDYATHLRSIRLPRHTREIGNRAFYQCRELEFVEMPRYVTYIGDEAFRGCERLADMRFPEGMQELGKKCFYDCKQLQYVFLPSTLLTIGDEAFAFCPLTTLQLPSGLRSLGYRSLDCTNLREITIPRGAHIEGGMPGNNKQLERIDVERGNAEYASVDGVLYDRGQTILLQVPSGLRGELILPDGLEEIAPYACMDGQFSSVAIPASVQKIGRSAFQRCANLMAAAIPSRVSVVEPFTFYGCANMGRLSLSENVRRIGEGALSGCKKLHDFVLPNGVVELGKEVFMECYGLREIRIPEGVTSLPHGCFRNCNGLTTVHLPSRLQSIGDEAFRGCQILPSVSIPQGVTTIGNEVFRSCDEIEELEIPGSVTHIGKKPFTKCPKLSRIICHGTYPPELKSTDRKDIIVIVPPGSAPLYQKASGWKKHKTIQENTK